MQRQDGAQDVWDKLNSDVFTIASVDNFDILKSHPAVYCGDQIIVIMVPPYNLYSQIHHLLIILN